jgi:uncharacterized protein (DUF1684 family)
MAVTLLSVRGRSPLKAAIFRAFLSLVLLGPAAERVAISDMDVAYEQEIEAWRRDRKARLISDGGWLTVVGLFWLKEGANRFGSDLTADIVLPAHSAPARAGVFRLAGGKVSVEVVPGVPVTLGGKPPGKMALRPDTLGEPEVLVLGRLWMNVVERGGRVGIRLKDMTSGARARFKGIEYHPIRPEYRVTGRLVPHAGDKDKKIPVPNVLGYVEKMPSPGSVSFELAGRKLGLEPVWETPDATELFFVFRDLTSGKGTYPAGRFFYATPAKDGTIVLDFNKAYSPPCAFTAFATCPLPPKQNHLPVAIEAGERYMPAKDHP